MKKHMLIFVSALSVLLAPASVSAHVTVTPGEAKSGERVTFAVNAPNEKQVSVTKIRVVIPSQLKSVTPFVKTGWNVDVIREGSGEAERVTEIVWSGGTIPVGLRDEFKFRSQVPVDNTELFWKAYETYEDGTEVAWDQPAESESTASEGETRTGPGTVTKVQKDDPGVADAEKAAHNDQTRRLQSRTNMALIASVIAVGVSLACVVLPRRKK